MTKQEIIEELENCLDFRGTCRDCIAYSYDDDKRCDCKYVLMEYALRALKNDKD